MTGEKFPQNLVSMREKILDVLKNCDVAFYTGSDVGMPVYRIEVLWGMS